MLDVCSAEHAHDYFMCLKDQQAFIIYLNFLNGHWWNDALWSAAWTKNKGTT